MILYIDIFMCSLLKVLYSIFGNVLLSLNVSLRHFLPVAIIHPSVESFLFFIILDIVHMLQFFLGQTLFHMSYQYMHTMCEHFPIEFNAIIVSKMYGFPPTLCDLCFICSSNSAHIVDPPPSAFSRMGLFYLRPRASFTVTKAQQYVNFDYQS